MVCTINDYKHQRACINGRTLQNALKRYVGPKHRFEKIHPKKWVEVCPCCDEAILGNDSGYPLPFFCSDGVARTNEDFPLINPQENILEFAGLMFSRSALNSAMERIRIEDSDTKVVENIGSTLDLEDPNSLICDFSERVCNWGRGKRVWGTLNRYNSPEQLATHLRDWLRVARISEDSESVIEMGLKIKGLGISFASKHLRMIAPAKYAALDTVLSDGLGFALNGKGYKLFMRLLNEFKRQNGMEESVAKIEAGIFFLVRQPVRIGHNESDAT